MRPHRAIPKQPKIGAYGNNGRHKNKRYNRNDDRILKQEIDVLLKPGLEVILKEFENEKRTTAKKRCDADQKDRFPSCFRIGFLNGVHI